MVSVQIAGKVKQTPEKKFHATRFREGEFRAAFRQEFKKEFKNAFRNTTRRMSGESYKDSNPSSGAVSQAEASVACPHCESGMPPTAVFCPACGWSMRPLAKEDRILAALAYFTLVPAGVLLLLPGFRTHRFIRFHAWQSALLWGVFFVLTIVAVSLSNIAAAMVFLLSGILLSLAMLFLWIVLSIKAWQGERFELPWFGKLAGRLR
jgi:uncharacterized membrane protein